MPLESIKYFFSYARQDSDFALKLANDLKDIGVNVWIDQIDIVPGHHWDDSVKNALKETSGLIAIISNSSAKSNHVINEIDYAINKGKWVVPILLENCELPFGLGRLQNIDFSSNYDVGFKRLLKALNRDQSDSITKRIEVPDNNSPVEKDNKQPNSKMAPKEIEYKFASLANTQLKFFSTENAEVFLDKLSTLCDILDINFGKSKQIEIIDEYFDDKNFTLKTRGCSFRRRHLDNDEHLVTLKSGKNESVESGIQQRFEDEFKCDVKEFKNILNDINWVSQRISERFGIDLHCGRLHRILTVTNRRTSVSITTKAAEYTLCYDKYYFYDEEKDYSEYFAEIEIELSGQHLLKDIQLDKLRNAVTKLFNYIPNPETKLERGLGRNAKGSQGTKTVLVMAFDIVEFANKSIDVQKQMIQKLNRYTKAAIIEIRGSGAEHNVIYLPTGDGMIMLFEDRPETIIPIVFSVQKKIKSSNDGDRGKEQINKFSFRTGLHSGEVFKYSDVNENLNFAGNGINLAQRLVSLGDKWQILATQQGYEKMGKGINDISSYFNYIGSYSFKYDGDMEVYNVHGHGKGGNPSVPINY